MIRTVLLALAMATFAIPGFAGFKMFVPGQKDPVMYGNETAEERAADKARDEHYKAVARHAEQTTPKRMTPEKTKQPAYTQEELLQGKSYDEPNARGPAPGGHRRHVWRERTGFNTPAERTRYENEVRRLRQELKKERAKPNPGGAHPTEIRKQFTPKF